MTNPVVGLAMPHRCPSGQDAEAVARGVVAKATWDVARDQPGGRFAVLPAFCWSSILPLTFDQLWAATLSARSGHALTHFAMIHDDIVPDLGWLDVMVDELEACGADLLSAVVPIKTADGLTSTAIDGDDPWAVRRLSMREVYELPETFTSDDLPGPLLVNTGLWVMRLDRPWADATETDERGDEVLALSFHQRNRILRRPDGTLTVQAVPEDWDFSRKVRSLGGVVAATRKVGLHHERPEWTNRRPWGRLRCDIHNAPGCEPIRARGAPEAHPIPVGG